MDNNYDNDKSYLDLISNIEKVQAKYAPEKADECKEAVLRAGELIHDFCYYEYGGSADFSDLHNVNLAYTTYTDEEKELQVTADLIDSKITYEYDGEVFKTEQYKDIFDMVENGLTGLDFDELVSPPDEVIESESAMRAFIVELDDKGTYERFALTASDFALEYPDTDISRMRDGDTDTLRPMVHIWAKEVAVGDDDWKAHFTDVQHGLPDNDIEDGNLAYVNYDKCSSVLEEAARETAFHLDFTAISIEDSSFDRDGGGASVYTAVLADDYHDQEVSDRFQFNLMKRAGLDIDLQKDGVEVKNFEDFRELRKPEELGLKIELLYAEYGDQEETVSARALYGSNNTRSEELTLTPKEQESLELFYNSEITPDKKEVQQEYDKEMS